MYWLVDRFSLLLSFRIFSRDRRPSSPPSLFTSLAHSLYPLSVACPSAAKEPVSGSEMPTVIGWAELLAVVLALVVPHAATASAVALAAANGTTLRRVGRLIDLLPSSTTPSTRRARCASALAPYALSSGKVCFAPIKARCPVPLRAPHWLTNPFLLDVLSPSSWASG